jgi:GrpB-like predicted nucleotidyltransferase (UPF0157 family)/RimJ/RimL family protein N-acetyltransferase
MSVTLSPYNPSWPQTFLTLKSRLQNYLASVPILSIEHIGSTSIPSLASKPIIDISIIVTRPNLQPAIDALVTNGAFIHLGDLGLADRHVVRDPDQSPRRNVYVCVDGAVQTRAHLGVRDTLRRDAGLREEYAAVKTRLAADGTDIVEYTERKSGVLQKILKASGVLSDAELAQLEAANKKGARFAAVKTERLVLREVVLDDAAGFLELEGKEDVVRYQTYGPWDAETARKEVCKIVECAAAVPRTVFELAVEYGGKFIGRVGARVSIAGGEDAAAGQSEDASRPHADVWFSFLPAYHGRGFATEAMRAFIPLLGSPLELEIECDPRNEGSWKMAERLGFERISLTEKVYECKGEWVDSLVYRKLVS